jgi:hypothetical protein
MKRGIQEINLVPENELNPAQQIPSENGVLLPGIEIGKRYKLSSLPEASSIQPQTEKNIMIQYTFKPINISHKHAELCVLENKKECRLEHTRIGDDDVLEFRGIVSDGKDFILKFDSENQKFILAPIHQSFINMRLKQNSEVVEKPIIPLTATNDLVKKRLQKLVSKKVVAKKSVLSQPQISSVTEPKEVEIEELAEQKIDEKEGIS